MWKTQIRVGAKIHILNLWSDSFSPMFVNEMVFQCIDSWFLISGKGWCQTRTEESRKGGGGQRGGHIESVSDSRENICL